MSWRDWSDLESLRIQQIWGIRNHFDPSSSQTNLFRSYKRSLSYLCTVISNTEMIPYSISLSFQINLKKLLSNESSKKNFYVVKTYLVYYAYWQISDHLHSIVHGILGSTYRDLQLELCHQITAKDQFITPYATQTVFVKSEKIPGARKTHHITSRKISSVQTHPHTHTHPMAATEKSSTSIHIVFKVRKAGQPRKSLWGQPHCYYGRLPLSWTS